MATDNMMQQAVLEQAADAGRATDTTLAHLTLGEVVIPREIMEDPEANQAIMAVFQAFGVDPREFTVGDPMNKINPETGYPEFFLKKLFKKIAPIALPILGSMIPGVGPVLGAALGGGLGGAISGGGIKGIATGAALGGLGGALTGGAGNVLSGAKSALGLGGLNSSAINLAKGGSLIGGSSFLPSASSGIGSLSSFVKPAASIYSGFQQQNAQDEAEKAMLAAQGRAEAAINPYAQQGLQSQTQLSGRLQEGFSPGDLQNDPGYQFRLGQGLEAQNRSLAAQGLGQSGAALKAAQEYGQNFAGQEYSNAYDRWLQQNQQLAGSGGQGANAAAALGNIYANTGNVQAAATLEGAERKNKTIQEILAGLGY